MDAGLYRMSPQYVVNVGPKTSGDEERDIMYFLVAGFFGAFTVTLELPALSFFCLLVLAMAWPCSSEKVMVMPQTVPSRPRRGAR